MAHYAKVVNNIVEQVIVADEEYIGSLPQENSVQWIQTSYNTRGNVHYGDDGKPDGGEALHGNYACIGYVWSDEFQVFHAPRPHALWILSHKTWLWESPIPRPDEDPYWEWSDAEGKWIHIAEQKDVNWHDYIGDLADK